MTALQLTQIGNSVGVIFPQEILARLKLAKGDMVFITEVNNGFVASKCNPETQNQMDIARSIMKKRRAVLHELAK